MRLLFVADVHLGRKTTRDGKDCALLSFSNILKKEKVDAIVIGGDLLENEKGAEYLEEFSKTVSKAAAKVFILTGNHDYSDSGNCLLKHSFPENVEILTEPRWLPPGELFNEFPAFFYPYFPGSSGEELVDQLRRLFSRFQKKAVLFAHATLDVSEVTLDLPEVVNRVAPVHLFELCEISLLGHFHGFLNYGSRIFYSGVPEPFTLKDARREQRYIIVEETNGKLSVGSPRIEPVIKIGVAFGLADEIEQVVEEMFLKKVHPKNVKVYGICENQDEIKAKLKKIWEEKSVLADNIAIDFETVESDFEKEKFEELKSYLGQVLSPELERELKWLVWFRSNFEKI